jgi:hypothetical protein
MRKLITILTIVILIVAYSAGSLFAANTTATGNVSFKNTWFEDSCKTSITVKLDGSYCCYYFIGAEIGKKDGSLADSETKGWNRSFCDVSESVKAKAWGCASGYGILGSYERI